MMTKREIRKFVKENWPTDATPSLADIVDFQICTLMTDKLNSEIDKINNQYLPPDRLAEEEDLAERIAAASTGDDVIRLMRKSCYFSNLTTLIRKALEMQDEVMPLIVINYKKSKRDVFIENAVKILAYADEKYARELVNSYTDIWLPYAQALVCYLSGYRGFVDTIHLLVSEFERLKRLYPNESFTSCPLMGLSYLADKLEK